MKQKEPGELAKVIIECEKAEYPELNRDLRKARDMLKSFGGGLGGTKTPDFLIEKLKSARGKKDRDLIKKTINECVSAGISELDNEIQLSRETLDTMEGGTGGRNHRDILHDMLLMATKRKSPPELKKAIEECEEAEYPELNEELRKARDVLENLSGSSGGTKTATTLLNRLIKAMEMRDKDALEKIINECIASGFPQLDADIQQARNILDILEFGSGGPSLPTPDALREELKKATRQKDKRSLENIIDVCETIGYAELGPDLCRARNTLQQIGGSRGGSMSPDILKIKLKDAMEEKNKKNLDRIINECTAAGFPELENDLQKARRLSNILEGGTGDLKSPNELRDQLSMAIRKKDADVINKAIMECEAVKYPELDADIRKARVALKNLGCSRGGSKSPKVLREMLSSVMQHGNKDQLESAVNECVSAGLQELDADVQKARELLNELREKPQTGNKTPDSLRTNLRKAMREGDKGKLDGVINECVAAGMPELESDIKRAKNVLEDMIQNSTDIKCPDLLRNQLTLAMKQKDVGRLEKLIDECEEAGYPELASDLRKARITLESLGGGRGDIKCPDLLRNQLTLAMKQKDVGRLEKLIDECEKAGYPELASDLRNARITLESLGGGRGG